MADELNITPAETTGDVTPNTPAVEAADTSVEQESTLLTDQGDPASSDGSEDGKPGDETPPKDGAEEAGKDELNQNEPFTEFNLPEGVKLDEQLLEKARPLFEEAGLTQEQAQKFVDLQAAVVEESARNQVESFNQLMSEWQQESQNDSEFGGEAFEENVGIARLTLDKFGTPEFKQLMESHGVGNHPEMIRFMWNIGKLLKEDSPGQTGGAVNEKKDRVSILYPED